MKHIIPEFIVDADNVYRTKHYIVKQILNLETCNNENNQIISFDTFYLRTKLRDKQYELIYYSKQNLNGKRLPSTMSSRKYIK